MEAALIAAGVLLGGSFLFMVFALLTKPRRMRNKARREAEARAKELADIYGRVAVTHIKLGGLERATRIFDEVAIVFLGWVQLVTVVPRYMLTPVSPWVLCSRSSALYDLVASS